jgi:hypothetical protein
MHHDAVSAFHGSPPHSPLPHWMVMSSYEQLQHQHQQIRQHFHGQFPPHFNQPQDQQQQQQQHQHQQQLLLLQQHQQQLQRCHLSEEHYPYEQRPTLVSQSNSFDSSFEAQTDFLQPQDLTLEASFLAERYGWSTSSVLEMMCELDRKRRSSRSMTPISDDDGADDVPRGVLDDVRFTPI